jgi:drug/metabolite transporter (DMT)-like permease
VIAALVAVVLWGTLAAVVGDAMAGVAPFRLLFWSFAFAAPTLIAAEVVGGRRLLDVVRAPPRVLLLGVWGILGYHALFYVALQRAPIVQANLLNYLWPLFMVLLAPVIVGEKLTRAILVGAALGCAGAVLVVTQGRALSLSSDHALGYACAFGAALAWSTFSLGLKRIGAPAEGRMPAFMLWSLAGALALALVEGDASPPTGRALAAVAWLGVGPLGLAFVAWGRAMASASAARVGVLSYLDPLLSTLLLAWSLGQPLSTATWIGMAAIVAGALVPEVARRVRAPPGPIRPSS